MEHRTDKNLWFLDMAERCARQGTCLRRCYGAVIVDSAGTVVSTGYTGAAQGQPHCEEFGQCYREKNNIPSGSNYNKCRSVHAEMNALLQAGKKAIGGTLYVSGIDSKTGKTLYFGNSVNPYPCFLCSKMILNSRIENVVYRTEEGKYAVVDVKTMYESVERAELGELKEEK